MIAVQPAPLADQIASLRAAAEAHTGRCWLTAALEAMIMAALARIFGRLQELVRLWQAGLLPGLSGRPVANTPRQATPGGANATASATSARPRPENGASSPASRAPDAVRLAHGHAARQAATASLGPVVAIRTPPLVAGLRRVVRGIARHGPAGPLAAPHAAPRPVLAPRQTRAPPSAGRNFRKSVLASTQIHA